MQNCGLVSITFRKSTVEEIVQLAQQANLKYIEWGSDVHVPEGDLEHAKYVAGLTKSAGLSVSAYGTYYKLGQRQDFAPYVDTAAALCAPNLRIWAGNKGSEKVTAQERKSWVTEAKEACALAAKKGLKVYFEYHPNTLTDTAASALKLIEEVGMDNCRLYWQPYYKLSLESNAQDLKKVLPYVDMVHLFYWENHEIRHPLAEGKQYLTAFLKALSGKNVIKLLEFVPEDNCALLKSEAQALFQCIKESEGEK